MACPALRGRARGSGLHLPGRLCSRTVRQVPSGRRATSQRAFLGSASRALEVLGDWLRVAPADLAARRGRISSARADSVLAAITLGYALLVVALRGSRHSPPRQLLSLAGVALALCTGGLLGVNAGSAEEARLIKLTYRPAGTSAGLLALVGKGIMYDSGGISLKPSDAMHALMKLDMSGAAAIFGGDARRCATLGCPATVDGYLMCTDNMPSGTATRLGDVLTIRGGKTVEVVNTDAEGRLVMADGLGARGRGRAPTRSSRSRPSPGRRCGPSDRDRRRSSATTRRLVDQAPGGRRRRRRAGLAAAARPRATAASSIRPIADIKNMGGIDAGTITAALFLEEFVDGTPFGHSTSAGPMVVDTDDGWRPTGAHGLRRPGCWRPSRPTSSPRAPETETNRRCARPVGGDEP